MGRMKDKQRRAMFAKLNKGRSPSSVVISIELKKNAIKEFNKLRDTDKDGTPNIFDSKPFDPKKQSFLQDFQIKRLRKQEAKLEQIKNKKLKELEDTTELLRERQKVASKKAEIVEISTNKKQAVIDEINRERDRISEIKKANMEAKAQLDKLTVTGRTKTVLEKAGIATFNKSKQALAASNAFLNKDSTRRTLRNITRRVGNFIAGEKQFKLEKVRKKK